MAEGAALEKRFSRKETWVRIPPSPPDYAKASSGKPALKLRMVGLKHVVRLYIEKHGRQELLCGLNEQYSSSVD